MAPGLEFGLGIGIEVCALVLLEGLCERIARGTWKEWNAKTSS